ncbi:MAG: hypoxanthine phosphoribosyltransferase [Dehalococcoidia bacterium]|nr:hypoxanthine phosphoribosyltransferase [Dehalococcoidia bacterium]
MSHLRRIISRGQIRRRVKELAVQIRADYSGQRPVFVCVLRGAFIFLADLVREVGLPLEIDFMAASSYDMEKTSKGHITILKDITTDIAGRPVILVDDIIDSGLTLQHLRDDLASRRPASLRVCALLARERALAAGTVIEYLGFAVPDDFLVGYGLDYAQQHRQLPDIYAIEIEDE